MVRLIKGPDKSMKARITVISLILTAVAVIGLSARLVKVMIVDGKFYRQKATNQQLYDIELAAQRGNIYDRNMELLATSAQVWTVYVTPNSFKKINDQTKLDTLKADIAINLSSILDLEFQSVLDNLNKNTSYVKIKTNVEKAAADAVREYIAGSELDVGAYIGLDESSKRYYPNDTLASTVLGFVGSDNQGLGGLESYYDSELTGVPGRVVAAKDAAGNDMPMSYELEIEAKAGNSLVSTLDNYVQYVCEKYLDQAIKDNKVAERGAVICMNVNTGEIYAMAVKDDYNPNTPFLLSEADQAAVNALEGEERTKLQTELQQRQWRNKAVSDTYEPGSVFKVITASMALEEGVTDKSHNYNCCGYIVIAGHRYNCHKKSGHEAESFTQAVQNSCNPVFITLGQQLGTEKFSKYFEAFGLTEKTGIDLPGEAASNYHSKDKMGVTELASSSFGQTFNVTPIQMITAISAAVNGGYLVTPHLVNSIIDNDGNTVKTVDTKIKRQVISNKTSETIRELLEAVVNGGGGKNAYVSGYRIGGKTGTSQKVSKILSTGDSHLYVSSFCGVAPIDDPEVALLVILDEPHGEAYYGGTIAAPVGGQILSEILPYLGYNPQYSAEELKNIGTKIPFVTGKSIKDAKETLSDKGLKAKVIGDGDTCLMQFPTASETVYSDGTVLLYTDTSTEKLTTTVPNLSDKKVSDVVSELNENNLNVVLSGTLNTSGAVSYKQSIESGTEVECGTVVTVYFRSTDSTD